MIEKQAIVLVGHGSRNHDSNAEFEALFRCLRDDRQQKSPGTQVYAAFLEYAEPSLEQMLDRLAASYERITVLPLFLFAAGHVNIDLPAAIKRAGERFPGVQFLLAGELGVRKPMVELASLRIRQTLEDTVAGSSASEQDTTVLFVGRGSKDGNAQQDFQRLAQSVSENLTGQLESLHCCAIAMSPPLFPEALERLVHNQLASPQPKRIVVAPYLLFSGRLIESLKETIQSFRTRFDKLSITLAPHLGNNRLLLDALNESLEQIPTHRSSNSEQQHSAQTPTNSASSPTHTQPAQPPAPSVRIFHGDNLPLLRAFESQNYDLIYVDPPFNTGRVQSRTRTKAILDESGDRKGFKGKTYRTELLGSQSFPDLFDDFMAFLQPRLQEAHRLLKPNGSFFLHLDYREIHYAKVMLDQIFGRDSFINEIIWAYDYGARSQKRWSPKHDNILWYVKDPKSYTFNFDAMDRIPYMAPGLVGPKKAARGKTPTDVWWHTIVSPSGKEKNGYPTQKPLGVLQRIINVHSNPGDQLLDFFAGSGTTGEAAAQQGRHIDLVDQNPEAIEVMQRRLGHFAPRIIRSDGPPKEEEDNLPPPRETPGNG